MRIGIFGGDTAGRAIDDVISDARAAEHDGFASFVLPQIFGLDAMGVLAVVGREVPRIGLATGVVPTYGRHPVTMAQQACTAQIASAGRFTLGIGLSHQVVIENMFGLSFDKPLRHMREYLAVLMPLLNDGKADIDGETISGHVGIDVAGQVAVPVLVAALGPKMLELAGTVTSRDHDVDDRTGDPLAVHRADDHGRSRTGRACRPADRRESAGMRHRKRRRSPRTCRRKTSRCMASYLPTGRCSTARVRRDRRMSRLWATRRKRRKTLGQLADAGVTEYVASIFGSREERAETRSAVAVDALIGSATPHMSDDPRAPLELLEALTVEEVEIAPQFRHLEIYTLRGLLTLLWHGPTDAEEVLLTCGGGMGSLLGPADAPLPPPRRDSSRTVGSEPSGSVTANRTISPGACTTSPRPQTWRDGAVRAGLSSWDTRSEVRSRSRPAPCSASIAGAWSRSRPSRRDARSLSELRETPLLLFHGTADEILPPETSAVVQALAGHGGIVLLPGAGHLLSEAADEIRERLTEWIPARLSD